MRTITIQLAESEEEFNANPGSFRARLYYAHPMNVRDEHTHAMKKVSGGVTEVYTTFPTVIDPICDLLEEMQRSVNR